MLRANASRASEFFKSEARPNPAADSDALPLYGYIAAGSPIEAIRNPELIDVPSQLRTGMVHINGASLDALAPFGGYKQSGNGREWGAHGIDEFLEVKSVYGYEARKAS